MNAEDRYFAKAWYGDKPIEELAKSSGMSEAAIRYRAVIQLKLGPRTTDMRDKYRKDLGMTGVGQCRRKEVDL